MTTKNEWQTPQWLYDALDEQFHFQADLACTIENCKAPAGFTKNGVFYKTTNGGFDVPDCDSQRLDSLHQSWDYITAFCNPPFSRDPASKTCLEDWIEKAYNARNSTIVMLIPNRPGNSAWQKFILPSHGAKAIVNLSGRINYEYHGKSIGSPTFETAIVVFWSIPTKIDRRLTNLGFKRSSGKFWYWTPKKPGKEVK